MKMFVGLSAGALLALWSLAAMAQSDTPAQPEQVALATTGSAHAGVSGSHSRHHRHRANTHKERARAGAEHRRQMRTAPPASKSY